MRSVVKIIEHPGPLICGTCGYPMSRLDAKKTDVSWDIVCITNDCENHGKVCRLLFTIREFECDLKAAPDSLADMAGAPSVGRQRR